MTLNTEKIPDANLLPAEQQYTTPANTEPEEMLKVPASQLRALMDEIKSHRENEEIVKAVGLKALNAFGLLDPKTGKMIDLKNGKGPGAIIIGKITEITSITKLVFNPDKEFAKLAEHFSFFKDLTKILEKYANQ